MRTSTFSTLFLLIFIMLPAQGQLLFNEVMAVNTSGEINPLTGEPGDWIEIYNGTGYTVDLAAFYLSDDPEEPMKWNFPDKTYLFPGKYHLIWADGTNKTIYGSHTNFKLGVTGETLFLHNRLGVLYDSMSFPAMHENISYGFSMDGSGLYFKEPTPGEANINGSGFLYGGSVEFDPPPAVYGYPLEVHITSDSPGGSIRYTLDGSPPGPDDPIYTDPIVVSENSVLRAQLWLEGFEPGAISTASYIVSDGFTFPVVSIVTDPFNFFDEKNGIYVEGSNGRPGYCMDIPVNWNMDWERPLSFEYFDLQGERQVQIDGGTKIHGGCSRTAPMKPLAFFARSRYGNNEIKYPFFSQKEVDTFKGLILRNSGNDNQYTYIRDGMIQAVVDPVMDVDVQAYEPVQLFLNGEYWGIHNLREKVNEHWVTSNYGIPTENLDFIKNHSEVFAGTFDGYDSLNNFLNNNSLEKEENFRYVADRIDLNSYTDYLFTHLFFANRDWPGNNQKYWRDKVNGSKWRHILFDLDFTMGIYEFDPSLDMFTFSTAPDLEEWPNPAWATLLIRRLLENESYKDQFIKKYQVHLNTTFQPERVNHVIDSFYYRLYDVFPAHVELWGRPWGGIDQWHFEVDQLRLFANERPDHVRENMRNYFSLGEEVELVVETPELAGHVKVNDVLLPPEGMRGTYTAGLDLDLDFQAAPGYTFNSWEVISMERSDTLRYYDPQSSISLQEGTIIKTNTREHEIDPNTAVFINEFMALNQGIYLDEYGEDDDWIELYNAGNSDVDLAGYYLTDDLGDPAKWRIPTGYPEHTTIEAKDHKVFFADDDTLQGPLHLNFKLSSAGESIGLSAKSGAGFIWLDSINFGPQEANSSYGRYPDGKMDWMAMSPLTPKFSNQVDHTSIETEMILSWSVFPNPATDWLNIIIDCRNHGQVNPLVISLWDLTGRSLEKRLVQTWEGQNRQRLDLSELPAGVYILTIETDSELFSKKIIRTGH